jgi:hypothetical protein
LPVLLTKELHGKVRIQGADFAATRHHIDLAQSPVPVSFRDLFEPSFWRQRLNAFQEGDLVRVIDAQRRYDIVLVVQSKSPGGLLMLPWPRPMPGTPEFDEMMAGVEMAETITREELEGELLPSAPEPAPSKKKVAA